MSITRRKVRGALAAAIAAMGSWTVVVACSSTETRETFDAPDAPPGDATMTTFDGTFGKTDTGDTCVAVAPTKPLLAAPTKKFEPGACTVTQVDGYVKDCLEADGNVCTTYKSANPTCAACAESTSDNPAWGPIVFYENRQFYDYNYGGCIANVTGDFTDAGCGAAQTRYLECRHAACVGCLPPGFPRDFEPFFACQNAGSTDTLCRTERDDSRAACATYFAAMPTDACQAKPAPASYLRQIIAAFCGPSTSDAGDAGDGGD